MYAIYAIRDMEKGREKYNKNRRIRKNEGKSLGLKFSFR
ncbi:MAG: hypothetical protein QG670_170, partial [Thermoproteota archaeon]|nr:hypothetical protein [Thermoproteota archaeon]